MSISSPIILSPKIPSIYYSPQTTHPHHSSIILPYYANTKATQSASYSTPISSTTSYSNSISSSHSPSSISISIPLLSTTISINSSSYSSYPRIHPSSTTTQTCISPIYPTTQEVYSIFPTIIQLYSTSINFTSDFILSLSSISATPPSISSPLLDHQVEMPSAPPYQKLS